MKKIKFRKLADKIRIEQWSDQRIRALESIFIYRRSDIKNFKLKNYLKKMLNKSKPQTLESQKEELGSSMDSSDHSTMVQREMMKIRKEGKMKENCVTDTHKIIYEAEKRVGKKKKDTEKYTKDK